MQYTGKEMKKNQKNQNNWLLCIKYMSLDIFQKLQFPAQLMNL